MNFFKNLFGSKPAPKPKPSFGSTMPSELLKALGLDQGGSLQPLFMLKDHPDIERYFASLRERGVFARKQVESIEEEHRKFKNETWDLIESYILERGLGPEGVTKDHLCLRVENGVMHQHVHD